MCESFVNCDKVYVKKSEICHGEGVFARNSIGAGDLVESGIVRVLTNCDGHENPVVFTWSNDNPNNTWAMASGCAPFYNSINDANTKMIRDFENNTFEIIALREIRKDEELFHTYKSLQWRECFKDLRKL